MVSSRFHRLNLWILWILEIIHGVTVVSPSILLGNFTDVLIWIYMLGQAGRWVSPFCRRLSILLFSDGILQVTLDVSRCLNK